MSDDFKNLKIDYESRRELDVLVEKETMQLLYSILSLIIVGVIVILFL